MTVTYAWTAITTTHVVEVSLVHCVMARDGIFWAGRNITQAQCIGANCAINYSVLGLDQVLPKL